MIRMVLGHVQTPTTPGSISGVSASWWELACGLILVVPDRDEIILSAYSPFLPSLLIARLLVGRFLMSGN